MPRWLVAVAGTIHTSCSVEDRVGTELNGVWRRDDRRAGGLWRAAPAHRPVIKGGRASSRFLEHALACAPPRGEESGGCGGCGGPTTGEFLERHVPKEEEGEGGTSGRPSARPTHSACNKYLLIHRQQVTERCCCLGLVVCKNGVGNGHVCQWALELPFPAPNWEKFLPVQLQI